MRMGFKYALYHKMKMSLLLSKLIIELINFNSLEN